MTYRPGSTGFELADLGFESSGCEACGLGLRVCGGLRADGALGGTIQGEKVETENSAVQM